MDHRAVPWPLHGIGLCVYGLHGAMGPVARALCETDLTVTCIASQRAASREPDPVEEELARQGLFERPEEVARRFGIPFVHLPDPNEQAAVGWLRTHGVNVVLSLSAPIFKSPFLDAFDGWVFNFHGSRAHRGRAGLSWNILNGLKRDAILLHWIDTGIDSGAVVDEEEYQWEEAAFPVDLFRAQLPCFEILARRFAMRLKERRIPRIPPPNRPYLPALLTERDGWLDWRWTPEQILRAARAFGPPYGGASASLEAADRKVNHRVRIGRCEIEPDMSAVFHPAAFGTVLAATPETGVVVACSGGAVRIVSLLAEGKEIPAAEVMRVGMRLRGRP